MSDAPCQRTPEGAIYPGRPGESLDDYLRRANAEFAAFLERNPNFQATPPVPREPDIMGLPRGGPGGGS